MNLNMLVRTNFGLPLDELGIGNTASEQFSPLSFTQLTELDFRPSCDHQRSSVVGDDIVLAGGALEVGIPQTKR